MNETTNHANGISEQELDERLRRIEKRYNLHWEKSESATDALHGGWLAGAEYVLGVLGYDFDVTDDGKLEIKA